MIIKLLFGRLDNELLQSISKFAEQTKKTKKIASPENTAHIFRTFSNSTSQTIWLATGLKCCRSHLSIN